MTKTEALSRIENIEGMTGSRAIALVDALDALGVLHLTAQLEQVLDDNQRNFREIKDTLAMKAPMITAGRGGAGGVAAPGGGTGG